MRRSWLLALTAGALMLGVSGCNPKEKVELRYDRPAKYEISPSVRVLGIAEFGGKTVMDRKWGDIASDRLAAQLDTYNNKYHRYQLVDRKRLKAILDEQDLQAAFSDSSKAVQAGKIAKVDAMIYGTVTVTSRDERATRTKFNPLSKSAGKEVSYTKRYVMTAVNFTVDSVTTGKTLASVATMREYDSDDEADKGDSSLLSSVGKVVGIGSDKTQPVDQVASQQIDQCVQEFLSKISPHEVVVTEMLGRGKSDAVGTGNKLAMAGDYAEALEAYGAGLRDKPEDHEAMFNSGVAYEALGKLAEAEQMYDRAFKQKPKTQYVQARKRVRQESGR